MGRPSDYKPEFCEELIAHMTKGYSFESFAAVIGVHRDTLYEWVKRHVEFSDAKKRARDAALYWWEKVGEAGLTGQLKGFNAAVWIFSMKNRFKWTDEKSAEADDGSHSDDEVIKSAKG